MRKNNLLSIIFLLIGFSLLVLILAHYNNQFTFRPDPDKLSVFDRLGIQIRYPFIFGVLSFIFVIVFNRLNSLFLHNLGVIGLVALVAPFTLFYLLEFIIFLYGLFYA